MAEWDPSTSASVGALVVALAAMFIAVAQALQQYFITGQLIRLCDSVVYGPMPGQGRRVWLFSQFRFRVIYSVPQISLVSTSWPSNGGALVKSYAAGRYPLPPLADPEAEDSDSDTDSTDKSLLDRERWNRSKVTSRGFLGDVVWYIKMKFSSLRKLIFRNKTTTVSRTSSSLSSGDIEPPVEKKKFNFSFLRFRKRTPSTVASSSPYTSSSSSSSSSVRLGISSGRLYSREEPSLQQRLARRRRRHLRYSREEDEAVTIDTEVPHFASCPTPPLVGEASWVSFCRAIEFPCGDSVRVDLVEYDADRCPNDMLCAPMQTSMRDVVIMALMAGMELTSVSFEGKSVSMQGAVGSLTSSNHPILGPILHFTPRDIKASLPRAFGNRRFGFRGKVDSQWMARTWDVCCVAKQFYHSAKRRTTRRLDDRWIRDHKGVKGSELHEARERDGRSRRTMNRKKRMTTDSDAPDDPATTDKSEEDSTEAYNHIRIGVPLPLHSNITPTRNPNKIPERKVQDGAWHISLPVSIEPPKAYIPSVIRRSRPYAIVAVEKSRRKYGSDTATGSDERHADSLELSPGSTLSRRPQRQPTVENVPDEGENDARSDERADAVNIVEPLVAALPADVVTVNEDPDFIPQPLLRHQTTVEDVTEEQEYPAEPPSKENEDHDDMSPLGRIKTAKAKQAARAERLRQIQEDRNLVKESINRGVMKSPYEEAAEMVDSSRNQRSKPLLLTNYAHNGPKDSSSGENDPETTKEEAEAREREKTREQKRLERDEARQERFLSRTQALRLTHVDIFWLCQIDATASCWATPWHDPHIIPMNSVIDGAVTIVLEALLGFLDDKSLLYTRSSFRSRYSFESTASWMFSGNTTFPAYALNARGGVIAEGRFIGVRIPAFAGVIPALELLNSYDWQVDSLLHDPQLIEEQNVELMRLDSWLSYVGRTDEISNGPHKLLKQTPALIQLLMEEFELDFQNIDLSAKEGGLQDIQGLAANVMDFLTDEELTGAEQLFVLVALLRAVKVAECVWAGSDTTDLRRILESDVQVHLV